MKMEEYIRGIPSGLLTAQLGEREIQVVGISENGFEFRLEKKAARQLLTDAVPVQHQVLRDAAPTQHCIVTPFCKVCFYDLEQALWQELVLTEYGLEKAPALSQPGHREKPCAASFYQLYRVCVTSPEFRIAVQKLLLQYTRYIHLKLEEDDARLAEATVGYPVELEDCFADSLEEQKRKWFAQTDWEAVLRPYPSYALELDRPEWYETYLKESLSDFMTDYWKENNVASAFYAKRLPDRIYLGNQFCRLLFPKKEILFALLEKARSEGLGVTVSFACQPEVGLKEAEQLLDRVGLLDKKDNYPRQLSGGQKQRVAIVRAMLMHPEIMLLDEITAALDPEMVREVLQVVLELAKTGMTMLIVTHEMEFARKVANWVVFMEDGVIVEDAPPEEFFEHPKNDRIRQFIRKVEER